MGAKNWLKILGTHDSLCTNAQTRGQVKFGMMCATDLSIARHAAVKVEKDRTNTHVSHITVCTVTPPPHPPQQRLILPRYHLPYILFGPLYTPHVLNAPAPPPLSTVTNLWLCAVLPHPPTLTPDSPLYLVRAHSASRTAHTVIPSLHLQPPAAESARLLHCFSADTRNTAAAIVVDLPKKKIEMNAMTFRGGGPAKCTAKNAHSYDFQLFQFLAFSSIRKILRILDHTTAQMHLLVSHKYHNSSATNFTNRNERKSPPINEYAFARRG